MHIPQSVVSGCWGLLSVTVQSIPKPQSLRPRDQLMILWQPGLLVVGENCVFHNHLASSCRRLLAVANCCSPLWLLQPLIGKSATIVCRQSSNLWGTWHSGLSRTIRWIFVQFPRCHKPLLSSSNHSPTGQRIHIFPYLSRPVSLRSYS